LGISNQIVTLYYNGNTYSGLVDTSSNISYKVTATNSTDASGHYSATIYDVTHGGKFVIYSDAFTYHPTSGTNIVTDGSGGVVTIPLYNASPSLTRTHAVSISSYVTYVDASGTEVT
jgi:hypothetical protein